MMKRLFYKRYGAAALVLGAISGSAAAAPEEVQVYMDEMNGASKFGLDVHVNDVFSGQRQPDYAGGQAPWHVLRVTPEFSYGLSDNWELGAYVLSSSAPGSGSAIDGEKLRLKYIAPKAEGQSYFWGANLEIGKVAHRLDENPWNGELKGILGWRGDKWTVALNPNVAFKISGPADSPPSFHLDSKVSYQVHEGLEYGLESYNEFGPLKRLGRLHEQSQTLFAVADINVGGWDLNLGLGRGLTPASDRWLFKAVIGVPFGAK